MPSRVAKSAMIGAGTLGPSTTPAYWAVVEGNFVSLAVFLALLAAAFMVAIGLRRLGAPWWLIFAQFALTGVSIGFVANRIHQHFNVVRCRHSANYQACMAAAHEAELPEWEPPTE